MNENVIVTDKKKIEEIRKALQSPDKDFANIKPAERDKLPENAKKIWFGIDKPHNPWYNTIVATRTTDIIFTLLLESKAPDEMPRVLSFS